jgi:hypothetical protein
MFLSAGFEFYESANGVILCSGDENGTLPSTLFAKVVHRKKGKRLHFLNKNIFNCRCIVEYLHSCNLRVPSCAGFFAHSEICFGVGYICGLAVVAPQGDTVVASRVE